MARLPLKTNGRLRKGDTDDVRRNEEKKCVFLRPLVHHDRHHISCPIFFVRVLFIYNVDTLGRLSSEIKIIITTRTTIQRENIAAGCLQRGRGASQFIHFEDINA